jgi:hypothetical protein
MIEFCMPAYCQFILNKKKIYTQKYNLNEYLSFKNIINNIYIYFCILNFKLIVKVNIK